MPIGADVAHLGVALDAGVRVVIRPRDFVRDE